MLTIKLSNGSEMKASFVEEFMDTQYEQGTLLSIDNASSENLADLETLVESLTPEKLNTIEVYDDDTLVKSYSDYVHVRSANLRIQTGSIHSRIVLSKNETPAQ